MIFGNPFRTTTKSFRVLGCVAWQYGIIDLLQEACKSKTTTKIKRSLSLHCHRFLLKKDSATAELKY
jgi:hypothetical protein